MKLERIVQDIYYEVASIIDRLEGIQHDLDELEHQVDLATMNRETDEYQRNSR